MAIRIRKIDGITVALCAARTKAEPGDVYLDDTVHHALSTKFALDWETQGFETACVADPKHVPLIRRAEKEMPDMGQRLKQLRKKKADEPVKLPDAPKGEGEEK